MRWNMLFCEGNEGITMGDGSWVMGVRGRCPLSMSGKEWGRQELKVRTEE